MTTNHNTHNTQPHAGHTPGPWRAQPLEGPGHWQIINDSCRQLAMARHWPDMHGSNTPETRATTEANARLIAAAPELLAALEGMVALYEAMNAQSPYIDARPHKAMAAIAKAKGVAS